MTETVEVGYEEGAECKRRSCNGHIQIRPVENCSCHISPPCSACTSSRNFCPKCGWEGKDDKPFNDHIVNVNPATGVFRTWTERTLDPSKIDWHARQHTNSSMIKEGVYPEGTSQAAVLEKVRGTFGGRFEYFDKGRFKYVAYTD